MISRLEQSDFIAQVPQLHGLAEQYTAFIQARALSEFSALSNAYFKCEEPKLNQLHSMRDICDAWLFQSEFAEHQNPRKSEMLFNIVLATSSGVFGSVS